MPKSLKRIRTEDRDLSRVQDRVNEAIQPLISNPLVDGVLVSATITAAGDIQVPHLLSRQPLGWIIVDQTQPAEIYRQSWDSRFLTLNVNSATILKIYVF